MKSDSEREGKKLQNSFMCFLIIVGHGFGRGGRNREGGLPLHCWDLRVLVISKNLVYSCGNCWDRKIFLIFLLHND
jgi:hypothetical protein